MRSCAILSSSSDPLTCSTVVFIGRTPIPSGPAAALRVSLPFCVLRGARNLSLCRVFRCRSKKQSVMERFTKAKFGAAGLRRAFPGRIGVARGDDIQGLCISGTIFLKRLKVRPLAVIINARVPPRHYRGPCRVGGANWYRRRGYCLKEISKEGGSRANRETTRMVKRKPRKTSYARRRKIAGLAVIAGVLLVGLVAFASSFASSLGGGDEISSGVSIGSVDVGGMTKAEAQKTVQGDASATFEEISFGTGKDGFSIGGDDLGVDVSAAQAVDEAYTVGRRGGVFKHISDAVGSRLGGTQIDLVAGYDQDKAKGVLAKAAEGYNEEPQNASFSVTDDGKVEVKEAENGRVLDQETTLANLEGALKNMSGQVPIAQGPPPKPEVTTAEVQSYKPEEVIGKFQTDFLWDSNPNRKSNMKLAAAAVNNTVLAPGEVFSFLKLTQSLHYKEAKTFSNGGIGVANGGGLCQVSSTVYMAANYAGLEIVERHPHYAVL